MKTLIYLHGFNSSPHSQKATMTRSWFETMSSLFDVNVVALPSRPLVAMKCVDEIIASSGINSIAGFIGSSLGGYYSLYLQHRYQLPAVLINPAIEPYTLLLDYLGENVNPYTGERYIVEKKHMEELKALDVASSPTPENLLLLTQTGDEVLDFQQAVSHLNGAKMWIQSGGNHAFEHFSKVLPAIHEFFRSRMNV